MMLRMQLVESKLDEVASVLKTQDRDNAFLRLVHSVVTGQSIHAFDDSDLVDGGQDKQIDAISIQDDGEDEATIHIIQSKNTDSFSSNTLIQMRNGLEWVFAKRFADVKGLKNVKFVDKIAEVRSILGQVGPSNIHVVVVFATKGDSEHVSDEFKQEMKTIIDAYDNEVFASFCLQIWGSDELVKKMAEAEKSNKKINVNVRIRHDVSNPSLIRYSAKDGKGVVCSASGDEIARIVNADTSGFIFDSNIRHFLGGRGAVNQDIRNTCTSTDSAHLFWFLNNGITIACDSFDCVTDPDNPHVKIRNIQIVNGCQTATTLAKAAMDGLLRKDVYVLLRIYETPTSSLTDRIVITTNNQNRITSRDLRANDSVQIDMQRGFKVYSLNYERKVREFDRNPAIDGDSIIPNEWVAQSYLAVVLKKPSDARRRKYKVWGEYYDKIFPGASVEPHIAATLIYRHVIGWLRKRRSESQVDEFTRRLASTGALHVARITAFYWRGNDNWGISQKELRDQIQSLQTNPAAIDKHIANAMNTFTEIVKKNPAYSSDLDRAIKSGSLDAEIDRKLYQSMPLKLKSAKAKPAPIAVKKKKKKKKKK